MKKPTIRLAVRELAESRGFRSQKHLGLEAGIDPNTISKLYRNQAKMISKVTLSRLCGALRCTPGDILIIDSPPTLTLEVHREYS